MVCVHRVFVGILYQYQNYQLYNSQRVRYHQLNFAAAMTKPNLSSNMSKRLSVSHSGISDSPLLKRRGLSHIQSNHTVPHEEEFQDGRSGFRSSPQTTSSRLDATYENLSTGSLDPVASKIPCFSQEANHLRVDYVPEDMVSGIGGLDLGRYSPRDMYKPIIRSYPYPYSRATRDSDGLGYSGSSPFIEHIDITTVWKGISLKDAQTLFRIHEAFKASLEILVIDALQKLSEEFRGECRYYRPDLSGDLSDLRVTRKLKFSQSQLSDTMHRMSSPWTDQLIGRTDQDFVMLLPLYLRTCDYLMRTNGERHQDTAIEVCARYEQPIFRTIPPRIVAEAAWIPDTLSFEEVHKTYREGHELVIIPHYCSNSVFRPEVSHRNIRYSLGSSQSWLEWDESISGFRGNVPLYSELRGSTDTRFGKAYEYHDDRPYATASTIFIEIKALLAERFPPRFRLERTVRARLSFKVLPWYNTYAPRDDYVKPSVWQYEGDFSPTVSSRKTSLSNVSLEIRSLHDEWDTWNQDWERSSSNDERQFNKLGHLQFPEAKSRQEFRNGQTISSSELASPTERHRAIDDDESTLSALSSLRNDETVDLDHEIKNEAFMMDHNSQEDGSPDLFGGPSEPPQILCFSRFSSFHGLSDGSNDEGTNRNPESPQLLCFDRFSPSSDFQPDSSKNEETKAKTSPVETNLDGSLLSRSQSSQDVCKEYNDHSSMMTDSIDEIHLEDQALPFSDICTKDLEIQDSQATLMNVGSAFTEAIAQTESLWPRQPSPSFPDTVKIKILNSSTKTPPNLRMAVKQSASESNRSCSDSSSLELIVENPDVDPRIRREQAILWRFLSRKESMARLSTEEQRNIYDAMKESAEEARRKNAPIDEVDVLDDIFLADGSNMDDGEDALSSLGKSEVSSKLDSGLGSVDTELDTSVKYGF